MDNLKNYYLNSKKQYKNDVIPQCPMGSNKPIIQECPSNNIQMNSLSCNNIWNNNNKEENYSFI